MFILKMYKLYMLNYKTIYICDFISVSLVNCIDIGVYQW